MQRNKNTDWFSKTKYGVFVHYLECIQNSIDAPQGMAKGVTTSWNDCVNEFDTDKFAMDVNETGADYIIFTIIQCSQYMIAPNDTFNKYTGYATGEACSSRDLVADLIVSLKKYEIKLMLYYTADGPFLDEKAKIGMSAQRVCEAMEATEEFRKKWYDVVREYSLRYGDSIHGWWVDGAHLVGYNDETLEEFANNLRAGNPKSIVCFNPGDALMDVRYYSAADDYVAGERNKLDGQIPKDRWLNDRQWHCLSPLGTAWGYPNVCYTADELAKHLDLCNEKQGVTTFDVGVFRNGSISLDQVQILSKVKKLIK